MYRYYRPNHWDDKDADDEDDDVERQADFGVIGETIASDALHKQVRLIANRGTEGCGGGYTDTDEEGHRVNSQLFCYCQSQREREGCGCIIRYQLSKEVCDEEQYR